MEACQSKQLLFSGCGVSRPPQGLLRHEGTLRERVAAGSLAGDPAEVKKGKRKKVKGKRKKE
jgi:hypothetical protein